MPIETKRGDKVVVELLGVRNFYGVIIESPTGVIYTNQCGGTACTHPEAEGFLVLLDYFDDEEAYKILADRWCGGEWGSPLPPEGELTELATLVEVCRICYNEIDLALDYDRMDKMWGEAWVPVVCEYGKGWLTWENSD